MADPDVGHATKSRRIVEPGQAICALSELPQDGSGLRFCVRSPAGPSPAFLLRVGTEVRAFLNRCGHIPVELDWIEGRFFDLTGEVIVCSTHGAQYDPRTGACIGGHCAGRGLVPLTVEVRENAVIFVGR